jgi:GGDEF domain-containing protein
VAPRLLNHTAMTYTSFYERGSKVLTAEAFELVLYTELKSAVRSQAHLTLVTVKTSREGNGMSVTADDSSTQQVAKILGKEIRDTDLLGHTGKGTLDIVLLDADFEHSRKVIDRLVSRIEHIEFPHALRISVGAASYPTDAVDADSLKRQAIAHPIANWRSRRRTSADNN